MNSLKLVTCVVNVLGSAGVGVAFTSVENHQFFLGTENKARPMLARVENRNKMDQRHFRIAFLIQEIRDIRTT